MKANPLMQTDLNVTVYEGRTLLTGTAPTPEFKAQAKEVASRVPGVRAVYDEIEVAPPESAWDEREGHLDHVASADRADFQPGCPLGQLHGRDGEQIGLSDRLGALPGRARHRHDGGANDPRRKAGRLLCRDPAGRARLRPRPQRRRLRARPARRAPLLRRRPPSRSKSSDRGMNEPPETADPETCARFLRELGASGERVLPIAEAALALASFERPRVDLRALSRSSAADRPRCRPSSGCGRRPRRPRPRAQRDHPVEIRLFRRRADL